MLPTSKQPGMLYHLSLQGGERSLLVDSWKRDNSISRFKPSISCTNKPRNNIYIYNRMGRICLHKSIFYTASDFRCPSRATYPAVQARKFVTITAGKNDGSRVISSADSHTFYESRLLLCLIGDTLMEWKTLSLNPSSFSLCFYPRVTLLQLRPSYPNHL